MFKTCCDCLVKTLTSEAVTNHRQKWNRHSVVMQETMWCLEQSQTQRLRVVCQLMHTAVSELNLACFGFFFCNKSLYCLKHFTSFFAAQSRSPLAFPLVPSAVTKPVSHSTTFMNVHKDVIFIFCSQVRMWVRPFCTTAAVIKRKTSCTRRSWKCSRGREHWRSSMWPSPGTRSTRYSNSSSFPSPHLSQLKGRKHKSTVSQWKTSSRHLISQPSGC